jgi:hypothetical protein
MYYSSADFCGSFSLKGESCKTFDIIIPTKSVFFKFQFLVVWDGGTAGQCPPPRPGCTLGSLLFKFVYYCQEFLFFIYGIQIFAQQINIISTDLKPMYSIQLKFFLIVWYLPNTEMSNKVEKQW